ncbi:MAG: M14 family zinc carboxypeptidase [Gammaproteobacteria bacterium]
MNPLATPLEHYDFQRYSGSEDIHGYLRALTAAAGPYARLDVIGRSAQGRPLLALVCENPARQVATRRLRVMLVGSQHGASEAAGCEALLVLARAVLIGDLQGLLDDFELVIVPNANPDGRERDSSRNGNDVNINRDFVLLSQPESCALDAAVLRYEPDVVLDAHESAILKRNSLGREGYLTTFEAQFDIANNPAIPPALRHYAERQLLPALIDTVAARGLQAQRYIREITSTRQVITHGGTTLRKFRNKAGVRGALTVLLETPMEPKSGHYPTYRNIGERREKQWCCLQAFLHVVRARHAEIARVVADREQLRPRMPLALNASYVENPQSAHIAIDLRRRDTFLVEPIAFADHRHVQEHDHVALPAAYLVIAHTAVFANLLSRHQIPFEVLSAPPRCHVERDVLAGGPDAEAACMVVDTDAAAIAPPPGALRVPVTQRSGRVLPLLLEPRSQSSVFRYPSFARLIEPRRPAFVARVHRAD